MREPFLTAAALLLAACTGSIGEPGAGGAGPGDPAEGPGTTQRPGRPGPPVPSPDTRLRRLTRAEYLNTVRDLFGLGDTAQVAIAVPGDGNAPAFDNSSELLTVDDGTLDRYDGAASVAIELALATGSASRAKVLPCDPAAAAMACARSSIAAFARRAWRRPIANDEVDGLLTAMADAAAQGDAALDGIKLALRMILVSPSFLYRVEIDPPGATGLHPVGPYELATRLSYFVWSSTPDDRLLQRADDGSLGRPEVLAAELGRMLADKRADALVDNFAAQWLNTRALGAVSPDRKLFPAFDEDLRRAMAGESLLFFRAFLTGDRAITDMFDAGFTFVNARLARHYVIPGVTGTDFKQVALGGPQRFGLLSQAGLLTQTSPGSRTSPTRRGQWVMTRLLCSPVPPPPNDAGALDPKPPNVPANPTVRDLLEAHRKQPRCVSCHAVMDPIGYGFENYNAVGQWRDSYAGRAVDATGQLPDGVAFDGPLALSRLIKKDPRFPSCFARAVFSYAMGREVAADGDKAAVEDLAADFLARGGRIKEIFPLMVATPAFGRRGGAP